VAFDARSERLLIHLAAAVSLASIAEPAFAQDAESPAPLQSATGTEGQTIAADASYRGTVALLYGIGYAGTLAGFYMIQSERPYGVRIAGAVILPSGAIATWFGPMLAHMDHGFLGKGLLSAGGQVVAAAAGIAAGYGIASMAGADEPGTAMLIGGLSAHAGWALFDTLVLARDERVVDRTIPAPTYTLSLEPLLVNGGGGVRAGALFRF
jgi:hypothetical protein